MPQLEGFESYAELPFASSLCGACSEICPVGIPLHERLLELRARLTEQGQVRTLGLTLRAATAAMQQSSRMEHAARAYRLGRRFAGLVPAGRAWTASRDLPLPARETFRSWWARERASRAATEPTRPAVPAAPATAQDANAAAPGTAETSLVERFAQRVAELGPEGETELHRFERASELLGWLGARAASHAPAEVAVEGDAMEKRGYELGISRAALLIADTGGIVLDFADRRADRIATLVETHVVVANPADMVRDVPEALRMRATRREAGRWHDMQVIVTGPSRTADVEKVLVIPAHGPRRLVVLLCDEGFDLADLRAAVARQEARSARARP